MIENSHSIGSYEAKTHLPALLRRAEQGEETIITLRGKPIARLVPYETADTIKNTNAGREKLMNKMRAWRSKNAPMLGKDTTLMEFMEESRNSL